MTVSLLDPQFTRRLPTPLAVAATNLATETQSSGVHTTADELSLCIEAFFGFLGRLWVAEYLAASAPDPIANAELHTGLVNARKDPQTGNWIATARRLRHVFLTRGLTPVARGLLEFDFGAPSDEHHPVSRLSAYRNSFAHGSFQSVIGDIVQHRELLEATIARLPCLIEQPILVDDGEVVVALRGDAEVATRPPLPLTPHHPTLVGDGGRMVDLYPLAIGLDAEGRPALTWTRTDVREKNGLPALRDIANHAAYSVWFERYERELNGHVAAARRPLDDALNDTKTLAELEDALARMDKTGTSLLLVESPPGAHRAATIEAAVRQSEALRWRVTPGELMGSGLVLVKTLARETEQRLNLPDGTIATREATAWRDSLAEAARRLNDGGQRVCLILDDLHLGDSPSRPGEPSIQEVYRALAKGPWRVIAGTVRAYSMRPLPWDCRVSIDWRLGCDLAALRRFLEVRANSPLHLRVIGFLATRETPIDLFTLCDTLEAESPTAGPLFEPAVERALWDIAPLLTLERVKMDTEDGSEDVRVFALLDRTLVSAALKEVTR